MHSKNVVFFKKSFGVFWGGELLSRLELPSEKLEVRVCFENKTFFRQDGREDYDENILCAPKDMEGFLHWRFLKH